MKKNIMIRSGAVAFVVCGVVSVTCDVFGSGALFSPPEPIKSAAVVQNARTGNLPVTTRQNADLAANRVQSVRGDASFAPRIITVATTQGTEKIVEMAADFVPASANGSADQSPFGAIQLPGLSSGQNAISNLNGHLEEVATWYGMSGSQLRTLLLTDSSVHIDSKGRILHIDAGPTAASTDGVTMATTTATAAVTSAVGDNPFPFDQTFKLHSKPGSTRVLYLNFIGQGIYPAFDTDKLPGTFSNAERLIVQKVLLRVAEDFAAFDVDITTEPAAAAPGKIGATILITPQASSIGGYAYFNTFTTFAPSAATAFCYPNNLLNAEKPIADCISHELGHTLGLLHQGQLPSTVYYAGQGAGETGWAPIMGVGYYKNLVQWAKGEYANANNTQDSYAVMLRQGLSPRADDHGDTIALADALTSRRENGLNNLTGLGVIESPADIDMFQFFAGAGPVSLTVTGAALGSKLDLALQLLDVNGKVLASSSTTATTLAKTIAATLPVQGVYYLSVAGAGRGNPLVTGYTKYGSIGQYSIAGKSALAIGLPAVAIIKPSRTAGPAPSTISFDASASTPTPGTRLTELKWSFGDGTATASTATVSHVFAKAGVYPVALTMLDSGGTVTKTGVQITIK